MAQTPHQTTTHSANPIKHGWNGKQEWKITILHQPRCSNRHHKNYTTILPIRSGRTQSNLGLPMVLSNATTYRLETRMDRSHSTTNCLLSPKCPKSNIHSMHLKCTKAIAPTRSLLYG